MGGKRCPPEQIISMLRQARDRVAAARRHSAQTTLNRRTNRPAHWDDPGHRQHRARKSPAGAGQSANATRVSLKLQSEKSALTSLPEM